MRALLIGKEPATGFGFSYVPEAPYDAVVIGSLTLSQLLRFREERVLEALAEGKPVVCYAPGFPQTPKNRALGAALASAKRKESRCICIPPAFRKCRKTALWQEALRLPSGN